jgi:cytochrome c biogenesis protein ResB
MLLSAFANLMRKGVKKMALRFALLVVCLVVLIFCLDYVLPKLIDKYRKYRELKNRKKRQEAFKKKMEELEIK